MRKLTANLIFDGYRFWENAVLIADNDGTIIELIKNGDISDAEFFTGLLMPGMVNAHCHLELSHIKNTIPEKTGLTNFLLQVIGKRDHTDIKIIEEATKTAANEMYKNGIVAVGDISNNTNSIPAKKSGNIWYHTFVECIGFNNKDVEKRLDYCSAVANSFRAQTPFNASVVPHAPYSVSAALFKGINALPDNSILSIHNQESEAENEFYQNKTGDLLRLYEQLQIDISFFEPTGKNSLPSYLPYFNRQQHLILVHNTFTTEEDILFAQKQPLNIFWCFCPNANLYIENRLPDISLFRKHSGKMVIGTDSLASNHQLSVLEEIKIIHSYFPDIPLEEILQWATINGAQALKAEHIVGSFEKGKKPGILQITNMDPAGKKLSPDSKIVRIT